MIDQRRRQNGHDDRERLFETRRQQKSQQLGFIADLGQRDDAHREYQCFHDISV